MKVLIQVDLLTAFALAFISHALLKQEEPGEWQRSTSHSSNAR